MGDINQDLCDKRVKEFFLEIGVYDAFSTICEIPLEEREKTFVRGTKCIDTVAVSYNILPFISKIKLEPFSTVIENDHVGFFWQFEVDLYFKVRSVHLDLPENIALNPNRISHVNAFVEQAEMVEKCLELKKLINNVKNHYIPEEVEFLDHTFTYIFRRATKHAEVPRRNAPFSEEKLQVFSARRYWRKYCRILGGATLNSEALEMDRKNGKELPLRDDISKNIKKELAQIELAIAKQNVARYLKNCKTKRDDFLYDLRSKEPENSDKKGANKRTIIKAIAKSESMKSTFKYLTSTVGKGDNSALTMVITYNIDNEVVKLAHNKETVEKTIIEYNTKHFKQALNSNLCCDKVFPRLSEAKIQQSIVQGNLPASECDDPAVHELLLLLRADLSVLQEQRKPITENELIQVVKKAKKKSSSSIFSRRTYAVYKCMIKSPYLVTLYVEFLNLVIQNSHVLKRWIDVVDIVLEKGKGPRLDKLRVIQLIEGDLQLLLRMLVTNRSAIVAEDSERLSKYNYGNRKGYDIHSAIVEKSFINDLTSFTNYATIHYIDDRKVCYDRQLPEIGFITELSFGMHQQEVNLLNGVLQNFNYYLSTAYGIAKEKYGGHNDRLAGTGQGNVLSGAICRNVSCLIFKQLEKMNAGIDLTSPVTRNRIMRLIIAFVDDADFFWCGPNAIQNMLRIISKYNKLYAATGGTGQLEKTTFMRGKQR